MPKVISNNGNGNGNSDQYHLKRLKELRLRGPAEVTDLGIRLLHHHHVYHRSRYQFNTDLGIG